MMADSRASLQAQAICDHWVAKLGLAFHPDSRGGDYSDNLTEAEIADYNEDMSVLFSLQGIDPYEHGINAFRVAGLV